jgi:hypothetical protein
MSRLNYYLREWQPASLSLPPIDHLDICYQAHLHNQIAIALTKVHGRFYPELDEAAVKFADRHAYGPAGELFGLFRFINGGGGGNGKPQASAEEVMMTTLLMINRASRGIIGPVEQTR